MRVKLDNWKEAYWKRKWLWAHRVAQHSDDRWTKRVAKWRPDLDAKRFALRSQARPRRRWDDQVQQVLTNHLEDESAR
eukprot:8855275-Karenia_brevis.AAC.1